MIINTDSDCDDDCDDGDGHNDGEDWSECDVGTADAVDGSDREANGGGGGSGNGHNEDDEEDLLPTGKVFSRYCFLGA